MWNSLLDLNPSSCPSHPTSIYTGGVTIALRVCDDIEKLTPSSGNDCPIGWVSISFQGEQESVGIKLLGYQLYLLCNYFQSFQKKKKKWWIQIIILFIFFIYMPIETMGYTMRDNSLLRSRVQVKLDPNFTNKASWH